MLCTFYALTLPSLRVPLGGGSRAQVIRDHLGHRRNGRWWCRAAQGVLFLPASYEDYLRGRQRQAVRTNIRRAREAGLTVASEFVENWTLGADDPRYRDGAQTVSEVDRWRAYDSDGEVVAEALVTVDARVALLHVLTSKTTYARWLLHSAIVERLCGRCELLLVNADDVPLLTPGLQHFQRLLGYSIVRLRLAPTLAELKRDPKLAVALQCLVGAAAMVSSHWILGRGAGFGEHAMVWVTALVAVRRASLSAGPASFAGLIAAFTYFGMHGFHSPLMPLGWAIAGVILDVALWRIPQLTWGCLAVVPAGVLITIVALLISGLGELGGHHTFNFGHASIWIDSALFGACAAATGWWLGGHVQRPLNAQVVWKRLRPIAAAPRKTAS